MSFMGWAGEVTDPTRPEGPGAPLIVAAPFLAAQAAAVANVAQLTAANDGQKHLFRIDVVITITAYTSGAIAAQVTYTDDGGNARTCTIPLCADAGAFAASGNAVGQWKGSVLLAVNPNTVLTLLTAGAFVATYNVSGAIEQVR